MANRSGGGPVAGQRKCRASYRRAGFAKNTLSRKPIRSPCAPNAEARKAACSRRPVVSARSPGTFPHPASSAKTMILIVIELAEAAGAFKRAFDALYASREALVAGAQEWALTLPSSDRKFRRILRRNCFHRLGHSTTRDRSHRRFFCVRLRIASRRPAKAPCGRGRDRYALGDQIRGPPLRLRGRRYIRQGSCVERYDSQT